MNYFNDVREMFGAEGSADLRLFPENNKLFHWEETAPLHVSGGPLGVSGGLEALRKSELERLTEWLRGLGFIHFIEVAMDPLRTYYAANRAFARMLRESGMRDQWTAIDAETKVIFAFKNDSDAVYFKMVYF